MEFIHIDREKTLVVFVSEGGIVHNRIIRSEREYTQPALDSMAEQLNAIFSGQNLVQVHREIVRQLSRERAEGTERMRDAFLLGRLSLDEMLEESEVYFEGTSNLLDKPEFSGEGHLKRLLRIFEQRRRLVRILDECIEQQGLNVIIGSENKFEDFRECSVIASTYGTEDQVLGSLAIIGPTRIEYGKMIPFVDSVAHHFSESILSA